MPKTLAELESQFAEFSEKQEKEKSDKAAAEAREKAAEKEVSEFVESQVKAGRVLPAIKDKFISFMKSLTSNGAVLEFTEKNGAKVSHSQLSLFKEIIAKLKPVVPVSQEYTQSSGREEELPEGTEDAGVEQFMEVRSKGRIENLPVEGADLAAKAFQFQEEQAKLGRKIDYAEALIAVSPKKRISAKA